MATPLTADQLITALRAERVDLVEVGAWRTHHRGQRGDGWGPVHGVMIHHTVSGGTAASVELCRQGHATLPGPLCHGVADKRGRLHLVGHGRTNHAGGGDPAVLQAVIREASSLPAPNQTSQDGNARFYGVEAINWGDGHDPWPDAQLECIARSAAAICRAHGWTERSVIGHAEWQPGKVDPRGPGRDAAAMMRDIRADVRRLLTRSPGTQAPPTPAPEAPMAITRDDVRTIFGSAVIANPGPSAERNPTISAGTSLRNIEIVVRRLEMAVAETRSELAQLAAALTPEHHAPGEATREPDADGSGT